MTKEDYAKTKNYLYSVQNTDKEINENIRRISELRAMAIGTTITPKEDRVQTSGSKDKIGDIVSEIADLEHETAELLEKYADLKDTVTRQICHVDIQSQRTVLMEKYINHKTIYEISVILDVSDRQCKRTHKKALENFFKNHKI